MHILNLRGKGEEAWKEKGLREGEGIISMGSLHHGFRWIDSPLPRST